MPEVQVVMTPGTLNERSGGVWSCGDVAKHEGRIGKIINYINGAAHVNLQYLDGTTSVLILKQDLEQPSQADLALQAESEQSRLAKLVVGARCEYQVTDDGGAWLPGTIAEVNGDAAAVMTVTFDIDPGSVKGVPARRIRKLIDEDKFTVGQKVQAVRDEDDGEGETWHQATIETVWIPARWELMIPDQNAAPPTTSDDFTTCTIATAVNTDVDGALPLGGGGGSDAIVRYRNTETGVIVIGKPADFAEHDGDETRYTIKWDNPSFEEALGTKSADEVREEPVYFWENVTFRLFAQCFLICVICLIIPAVVDHKQWAAWHQQSGMVEGSCVVHSSSIRTTSCHACDPPENRRVYAPGTGTIEALSNHQTFNPRRAGTTGTTGGGGNSCSEQTYTCYNVYVTLKDPRGNIRNDQVVTRPRQVPCQQYGNDCKKCLTSAGANGWLPSSGSTVTCYHTDDYATVIMDKVNFAVGTCMIATWICLGIFCCIICILTIPVAFWAQQQM